jgi:hygromycin-B 4-O-kinase
VSSPKPSLEDARAFLCDLLGSEIEGIEPLQGGHWSRAFGFRAAGRDLVARFSQYGEDFQRDRVAGGFSSADLPIPEVLDVGQGLDGYYCVSQRAFGEMLDGLPPGRMRPVVPAVLRALDGLRGIDHAAWIDVLGEPALSWHEQLLSVDRENERVFGWHDRMASSPTGDEPYKRALAYLREHVASLPEGSHVVHNDLLHNNVLVAGDSIVAVIDWGNAIIGDFLYDLAQFTFYAPWFPSMEGIDWLGHAKEHYRTVGLDLTGIDERLRCYEAHLGLSGMAYNAFKGNWAELEANARRTQERLAL